MFWFNNTSYWTLVNITNKDFPLVVWWRLVDTLKPWKSIKVLQWQAELWANKMVKSITMALWTVRYFELLKKLNKQQSEVNYSIKLPKETKERLLKMALWEIPLTKENAQITDDLLSWAKTNVSPVWFFTPTEDLSEPSNEVIEPENLVSLPDWNITVDLKEEPVKIMETDSTSTTNLNDYSYPELKEMCKYKWLSILRDDTRLKNKQELIDTLNSLK